MSSFLARRTFAAAPAAARAFSTTPARPLAKVTVIGNIAASPEVHATSTGREMIRYSIASNSGRGENIKTSWFRVNIFENEGPRRDYFLSIPKGSQVYIEGDLVAHTYEDAEGKQRTNYTITQRNLEVLRRRNNTGPASE